ncbi:MAG: leucyl aminopeptidase family protein [Sulfuritalea sp.]|jgi:leucyl aminopeptidase|nr:leucyl aminopeptidase family protein [Sulfuritalea sp.]
MNLPRITLQTARDHAEIDAAAHGLVILPASDALPADLPRKAQWLAVLKRKAMKPKELAKTPLVIDLSDGRRLALLMADITLSRFERLTRLRKAVMLLLDESPKRLAIRVAAGEGMDDVARDAIYVALINGVPLPARKKKPAVALAQIDLFSALTQADLAPITALARANLLARELTALAPNELTPATYRKRICGVAKDAGLAIEEFDFRRLKKMGAGAFCAVAQGSHHEDAAIVHLSWQPKSAKKSVALVGKGICFDTGGHNLKPARYMAGMHEDMNGSAVALALMLAAVEMKLPVAIDCWLAIAHNHLSPSAYKQNDIVTALDGTTVEIVHTDAEGRMVLADTLLLATGEHGRSRPKAKPDLVIDFATLTGSMHVALGARYSGVFASGEALGALAVAAGHASGERVCVFPLDEDYDPALDSKVADVKQCTLDGEADHILAARFLQRFTRKRPWMHVDLSASSCSGGLGATASDLTGFGVAWGLTLLARWLARE